MQFGDSCAEIINLLNLQKSFPLSTPTKIFLKSQDFAIHRYRVSIHTISMNCKVLRFQMITMITLSHYLRIPVQCCLQYQYSLPKAQASSFTCTRGSRLTHNCRPMSSGPPTWTFLFWPLDYVRGDGLYVDVQGIQYSVTRSSSARSEATKYVPGIHR